MGGLTVVHEIFNNLPNENIVYFGDTARLPYGTKSRETVQRFSVQNTRFLLKFPVKMIVVACNTASAEALHVLKSRFDIPIVGVIDPGARAGIATSVRRKIGVIGTRGTIKSEAYQIAIHRLDQTVEVHARACPLFVPLVEEGWLDGDVLEKIARHYLDPLLLKNIDVMILGCTHYPVIKSFLQDLVGPGITLVDSAWETARAVREVLDQTGLHNDSGMTNDHHFFVSDYSPHFHEIGERCLGQPLKTLDQIDLDEFDLFNDGRPQFKS